MKVIIIGSGFASSIAILHLRKLGIKPIVIDVANNPNNETKNLLKKDAFIKKKNYDNFLFLGGLSSVWTGAIDKYDNIDLKDWPINYNKLNTYYNKLPKLIKESGIYNFTIEKKNILNNYIDKKNNEKVLVNNKNINVKGASLILSDKKENPKALNFKGYINRLIKTSKIKLIKGKVEKIWEYKNEVSLEVKENNKINIYKCDYLFVGSGSPSTLKIIQNSQKVYNKELYLKKNKKIVYPVFFNQTKKIKDDYKNFCNPYPIIQINHFSQKFGNIYSQISNFNETLLSFFLKNTKNLRFYYNFLKPFNKFGFAYTSLDSKFGDKFTFDDKEDIIVKKSKYNKRYFKKNLSTLTKNKLIDNYFRFIDIPIFRDGLSGNHFGSVFPMRKNKRKFYDSDVYGRICNYKRISILDSSVFTTLPSKPPTFTIMANALRIVESVTKKFF